MFSLTFCFDAPQGIVACAAGFADALGQGQCTKGAILRAGILEMIRFIDVFHPQSRLSTFFESCGLADLVSSCNIGRHRRLSEEFARTGKTVEELEQELLHGNRLQGPHIARETYNAIVHEDCVNSFPLFVTVHKIFEKELLPDEILRSIASRTEHI
ncbi:glycerol-3-phosphate dehydrogenase [NAD(+)], cytoplasmic-like [Ctenocephalides felis]|uniref:glycerol-3-phosphate dehydrogenase [NAD(+)], cytoplasmic-like n=1 Tax=Ctenocephalides felis TaxID=7515 RepID=UPI000E6E4C11|nr:glycerol-3-phosphate dehydrogenase [NAD(+)], cytoplasmic-like [Ctenocephalides felis]